MKQQQMAPTPDFVGYEYVTVPTDDEHEPMLIDAYRNFGWEPAEGTRRSMLRFRRDRSMPNRVELTRLQRQFDAHMREMGTLEQAPARRSSVVGLSAGFVGCVFLGGATFAYLGGLMALMVVLAVPGLLCWLGAYPLAKRVRRIVAARNEPAIDHLHDMNYDVCRRANVLLPRVGGVGGVVDAGIADGGIDVIGGDDPTIVANRRRDGDASGVA